MMRLLKNSSFRRFGQGLAHGNNDTCKGRCRKQTRERNRHNEKRDRPQQGRVQGVGVAPERRHLLDVVDNLLDNLLADLNGLRRGLRAAGADVGVAAANLEGARELPEGDENSPLEQLQRSVRPRPRGCEFAQ